MSTASKLLLHLLADREFNKNEKPKDVKDTLTWKQLKQAKKILDRQKEEDEKKKKEGDKKKPKLGTVEWIGVVLVGIPVFIVAYPAVLFGAWKLAIIISTSLAR